MVELPARLLQLRERAKSGKDPTCADGTLGLLLDAAAGASHFLEIGAGEGLTSLALCLTTDAEGVAIERDGARCERATENFASFGVQDKIRLIEGDAADVLPTLEGEFDLIFLDCAKVQYRRFYDDCKRLLRRGGTLVSDDVLLYGWVTGEPPKKRKMLAGHLREFLQRLCADRDFATEIYEYGEGVAVSTKL